MVKEENAQKMKQQFMAAQDVPKDGCIWMKEVSFMTVPSLMIPSWASIFSAG